MRIVVDVNHPGHVHYFKHFIWEMKKKGHEVLVTASEKDITFKLLEKYDLEFENMGSYGTSLVRKLANIPIIDIRYYRLMRSFKPDIFVGFGSIRAAHVSFLLRKPCINFEDTEHSTEQIRLYLPFVTTVCTPSCYTQVHQYSREKIKVAEIGFKVYRKIFL
jgi:predicted glycosyltransferase